MEDWEVRVTDEILAWISTLDSKSKAGDKSGDWSNWYRRTIPQAEELYAEYVKERESEEGQR